MIIKILPTKFNCIKLCRNLPGALVLVRLKVFFLQIVGEHWIQMMISALLIYVIQPPTDVTYVISITYVNRCNHCAFIFVQYLSVADCKLLSDCFRYWNNWHIIEIQIIGGHKNIHEIKEN